VKTEQEVLGRLKKLRIRYTKKYVDSTQKRCFLNCRFNHEQVMPLVKNDTVEYEITPRCVSTVVIIDSNNSKACYCTYGVQKDEHGAVVIDFDKWNGKICDRDEIAEQCEWFVPVMTNDVAEAEFNVLLEDDKWVYENHKDIAALQWVLGDRVHKHRLSLWDRFWLWVKLRFTKPEPARQLPISNMPGDMWDDSL